MNFYDFLWFYLTITLVWLLFGIIGATGPFIHSERVQAARFAISAPIWPIALVYLIVTGLRNLIKLALDK